MAKEPENTSAAPAGAAAGQTATIRYIDRPECTETFADSINHVYFDGQSLRIEFGVTRLDDVKQNAPVNFVDDVVRPNLPIRDRPHRVVIPRPAFQACSSVRQRRELKLPLLRYHEPLQVGRMDLAIQGPLMEGSGVARNCEL